MKMSEILRKLADTIDAQSLGANQTMSRTKSVKVEKPEDFEGKVMVPPLQSKLELLKKSAGVESIYDEDGESNELSIIKKNAGLMQQEASEDNDITG